MLSFCFSSSLKNNFLMSCLKVLMHLHSFVSASRLFHVFGQDIALMTSNKILASIEKHTLKTLY